MTATKPKLVVIERSPADVVDIVPNQKGLKPKEVVLLKPDVERLALRRAVIAITAGIHFSPAQSRLILSRNLAAIAFKVDLTAMLAQCQTRGIVRIRWFAMALADRFSKNGHVEIGRIMGGRDHTTVINGLKQVGHILDQVLEEAKQ